MNEHLRAMTLGGLAKVGLTEDRIKDPTLLPALDQTNAARLLALVASIRERGLAHGNPPPVDEFYKAFQEIARRDDLYGNRRIEAGIAAALEAIAMEEKSDG